MKNIDVSTVLILIGLVLFLGGIILNISWLFLVGFFWLGCSLIVENTIWELENIIEYGNSDSDDEMLINYE